MLANKTPGLSFAIGGQSANSAETVATILRGFLLGLVGIYFVLSFQFRSYIEPIIVMLAIPLAFIGVVLGHLLMGYNISTPSLIGVASLASIVVNSSILLVQVIKRRALEGMDIARAAGQASRERFRPIFVSVSTTLMGLAPPLLERSTQAQTLKPLVISVTFGLLSSTGFVRNGLRLRSCILTKRSKPGHAGISTLSKKREISATLRMLILNTESNATNLPAAVANPVIPPTIEPRSRGPFSAARVVAGVRLISA